ncbi:molybdopterin-synthase adenylyltransferase MoeB [Brevibacterium sp.]|uniref:molybdopterin-synthase adenylyltransferase MoeB n=1 Tax=Brevibacterium sp. TaxID=1701 RepID=UPI00264835FD|nr:molybdopterin-synthase adenylyltransferase MoeB [Brevibacterium sp.]MDN5808301.1 molybdopterin-synthase adenylyltransferase MoeB [Brevibacterium sp.]MDN5834836.1 molybdopterin-synthase adenylyltransferase MoeB [Brevibacterium sp.]MDN5877664.1 molybdopterin-synthase adenylyltransferase MoeB [Brevibacterium sp.]MDN5910219.1 molybdopterin-synthase adenylyltransferase MoeB [Brevibacterium sp.]MDN6133510.1 molybdopterin-synthase adenylyltransferase MoeB [Brevibacterium sp.]
MKSAHNPGPLVAPVESLSSRELDRYARHLSLPGLGVEGQGRLRAASALVIGAGGLGAPVLNYLAAAGIGSITIIDDDVVEASNLQRQVLHRDADIGRAKVESARDALLRLDPDRDVRTVAERLSPANALELFDSHDVVLDGADNFATRYLSNDAAELTGTPLVWGTIFRFAGQVSTFVPGHGPMLRDLFPDIPEADSVPNCAEGGVLGVLCGTVGSAMATEAVKLICGIGTPLIGRLLRYDALEADYSTLRFSPDPDRRPVTDLAEVAVACAAARPETAGADEIDIEGYQAGHAEKVLVDVRAEWERRLSSIPGSVPVPLEILQIEGWPALAAMVESTPAEVVIHCKSGARSAQAVQLLKDTAPDTVRLRSLAGGIDAWSASGRETVQAAGQTSMPGSHHE